MDKEEGFKELDDIEIPSDQLTVECCVGAGLTSEVFKGTWTCPGRGSQEVAIKKLVNTITRPKLGAEEAEQDDVFIRELKVLIKVQQDNLVRLHGVQMEPDLEGRIAIVTEFCEGGTCFELLHNNHEVDLSYAQREKMCIDVAAAMVYLHNFTPMIIHRDLKSLNLLLDREVTGPSDQPLVKVCDFGVAKLMPHATGWKQMTAQAGTKHWMAPEMWTGSDYDEKVDVYSYAMVVFEIICREVPFGDEEPADVGQYILNGVRPDMEAVPPDCPGKLVEMMQACWSHAPEERPSFKEVMRALAR